MKTHPAFFWSNKYSENIPLFIHSYVFSDDWKIQVTNLHLKNEQILHCLNFEPQCSIFHTSSVKQRKECLLFEQAGMTSPFRTFAINQNPTSGWRVEKILSTSWAAKSNKLSSGGLALRLFTIHLQWYTYRLQLSATLRPFYRAVREGPLQCPSSAFNQCATTTGCFNHLQWFHSFSLPGRLAQISVHAVVTHI